MKYEKNEENREILGSIIVPVKNQEEVALALAKIYVKVKPVADQGLKDAKDLLSKEGITFFDSFFNEIKKKKQNLPGTFKIRVASFFVPLVFGIFGHDWIFQINKDIKTSRFVSKAGALELDALGPEKEINAFLDQHENEFAGDDAVAFVILLLAVVAAVLNFHDKKDIHDVYLIYQQICKANHIDGDKLYEELTQLLGLEKKF